MGAVFDEEDDELDFSFLNQDTRRHPKGAAAGLRADDRDRDQMANLVSECWQRQAASGENRRRQAVSEGSRQRQAAEENWQRQAASGENRRRQAASEGSRQRQAAPEENWQRQAVSGGSRRRQARPEGSRQRQTVLEESWQRQASSGGSGQRQAVPGGSSRGQTRQGARRQGPAPSSQVGHVYLVSGSQKRSSQGKNGQEQKSGNKSGRTRAVVNHPQPMQEKQSQRQAKILVRKRRRLRFQKQLLAVLLGILLTGTAYAVLKLWQIGPEREMEAETGGQAIPKVQAEGAGEDFVWGTVQGIPESQYNLHPEWTEDFLTISEYSRPGEPLNEVKNIFVHYTANPNTSAAQNRNYFENLKDNHDVPGASSHFIIGINGEILQIVPLDEIAYAVQTRNEDSISIECCFKNQNGQFTQETYDSLIELLAWLVNTYELEPEDILRHYDCGGKKCPLYYVEHEDAWEILKRDVANRR